MRSLALALLLLTASPVWAQTEVKVYSPDPAFQQLPKFLERAASAEFLYVGERHDKGLHHAAELTVLKYENERHPAHLTLCLEMVQSSYQAVLDDFIAGKIDIIDLRTRLDWAKSWGFDFAMYAPIFQFCQEKHIPIRALRFPRDLDRRLGKEGIDALTPELRTPLASVNPTDFGEHPEELRKIFADHMGAMTDEQFARFLRVQVLWEEGMAAQIEAARRPGYTILVFVGAGHLTLGHGLPERVRRRIGGSSQVLLLDPSPAEQPRADLIWKTDDPPVFSH